jgi:hypothetical protein
LVVKIAVTVPTGHRDADPVASCDYSIRAVLLVQQKPNRMGIPSLFLLHLLIRRVNKVNEP